MTVIVFSKDRALQLDAFLRSFMRQVAIPPVVKVLYTASSRRHDDAYNEVFFGVYSLLGVVGYKQNGSFKGDLLSLLPCSGEVAFFVDDQVFIRTWDGRGMPGLSLRLGENLTRCYPVNTLQPLPILQGMGEMRTWRWSDGELDWRYPLSLDGHVFRLEEIRLLIESAGFSSPNTLESALQVFLPTFLGKRGTCFRESKVVNVPWTRVQQDYDNRHAGLSVEDLLDYWEAGHQIDLEPLYGVLNESAHQEFPLVLERRP